MSMPEQEKADAQDSNIGLYTRMVEALEQRPAYLLVFAISAIFLLSGVGSSVRAFVNNSLGFGVLAVISFAIALGTVVVVVREVERNWARAAENQDHRSQDRDSDEYLVPSTGIENLRGTWKATWSEKNKAGVPEEHSEQLTVTDIQGTRIYGTINSEVHQGRPCKFEGVFTGRFLQLLWSPANDQLIHDFGCYFFELYFDEFRGKEVGFFYHLNRLEAFDVTLKKLHS